MAATVTDDPQRRFADVVVPLTDQAYRLAYWLTRNRADAEDVVQDAALRAFRAMDLFAGSNPRAWFLAVVRHTAFTWLGKNRPKDLVVTDDVDLAEQLDARVEPAFGARPAQTPEDALIERERSDRVQRAVGALPAHYREIVVLRELEDLSYRDIAEILDIPIGTVMSRLARARSILIRTLADER